MTENMRFTIWVDRRDGSMFGASSRPVNRNGLTLSFRDERCASAECDRLIASSGDPYARYTVKKESLSTHPDLERRLAELAGPRRI
jgi:hypothetical protein